MRRRFALHAPLLPLAICLAAGIAVGRQLPSGQLLALLAGMLAATALLRRQPVAQSLGLWACSLVLGMLVAPTDGQQVPDGVWTEAVVVSEPAERPKTLMTDLLLTATGERRRCFFWKEGMTSGGRRLPTIGDNIMVVMRDGKFVNSNGWRYGGDGYNHLSRVQRLRIRALQWRANLLRRFRMVEGDDSDAHAVLAAMVLGDKSALSSELRDTYSVSGASHVLALSGLHLTIVYVLLSSLMLGRRRFWLNQVAVVLGIWAFALLTGLSNSVVRAAIMLTVYSILSLGGRRRAPLGVLSFTAIVMLLADSSALFDVGFQLSFMSMLAILLFMPLAEGLLPVRWQMSHRLWRWLLGMVAVSVAAQVGTAPLVAYYFGRFPTWFLLTNIVVVPVATLILYGAVAVLLFPSAGGLLIGLTGMLNSFLSRVSSLPLASIEGLHPSGLQVTMMYVVILAFYLLMKMREGRLSR